MAAWVPKESGREGKAEVRREEAGGGAMTCLPAPLQAAPGASGREGTHGRLRTPQVEPDGNKVQGARGWKEAESVSGARVSPSCQVASRLPASPGSGEGCEHSRCRWGRVQARAVNRSSL